MASSVIGALRVNLGIDTAAFSKDMKGATTALQKFGKLAKVGLAAAATAATAAIGSIGYAVKNTIDAADEMSKAASKIGVPIEELSRLKYAADLSGISFESLQSNVKRLSQNMVQAGTGTGAAATAFAELGISVKNADGSMKSSSQVLAELADRFAAMPDGVQKTALAAQIGGKAFADMIPLLNGGSEALNKLLGEADQFGQVFTAEMGANAEAFNDNISRLQGAFGNVAAAIAEKLLPYLAQFSQWLVDNRDTVAGFAVGFVEFGASAARGVGVIIEAFTALAAVFASVEQGIIRTRDNVIGAFVSMKDGAVAAVTAMVDAIPALLGRLNAPFVALNEKIASIGNTFKQLYVDVVGNSYVPDMVVGVEDWMGRLGKNFGNTIAGLIDGSLSWRDALAGIIKELGSLASGGMGGGGGGGFFGNILNGLVGGLTGMSGSASPMGALSMPRREMVNMRGANSNHAGQVEHVIRTIPSPLFVQTVESRVVAGEKRTLSAAPAVAAERQARTG